MSLELCALGLSLGNYRLHVVLQNIRTPKLLINKNKLQDEDPKGQPMYPDLSQWQVYRSNPTKSVVRQMTVKITKYLI